MPLEGAHEKDFGMKTQDGFVCKHDMEDGELKSDGEIFEGGVQFFLGAVANGNRALAERLTRKNMKSLPYWKKHPSPELDGPEATDREFADAMSKL
jgi:hypothetical protein